tara:strand:- start:9212 stop:9796 length:585 start_codon:yes stop_codon:yes gene_type:complete
LLNQAALATMAVTDLMYQMYCYRNDMRVYVNSLLDLDMSNRAWYNLSVDDDKWNRAFLVDRCIEGILSRGGSPRALEYFALWVAELFATDDVIINRGKFKCEQVISSLKKKKEWEAGFNRVTAAQKFISDPLIPIGPVHYRYVYHWDLNKGYHLGQREMVSNPTESYWQLNPYWFDYFGIAENDNGQIRYIDYE